MSYLNKNVKRLLKQCRDGPGLQALGRILHCIQPQKWKSKYRQKVSHILGQYKHQCTRSFWCRSKQSLVFFLLWLLCGKRCACSCNCVDGWGAGNYGQVWYQTLNYFSFLQAFVERCATHSHLAFLNIMDKGYHCTLAGWQAGWATVDAAAWLCRKWPMN